MISSSRPLINLELSGNSNVLAVQYGRNKDSTLARGIYAESPSFMWKRQDTEFAIVTHLKNNVSILNSRQHSLFGYTDY